MVHCTLSCGQFLFTKQCNKLRIIIAVIVINGIVIAIISDSSLLIGTIIIFFHDLIFQGCQRSHLFHFSNGGIIGCECVAGFAIPE